MVAVDYPPFPQPAIGCVERQAFEL